MLIGIDASRAFLHHRTGIEEYAFRVIQYLQKELPEETSVVLYTRQVKREKGQETREAKEGENFPSSISHFPSKFFPSNGKIRTIPWKYLWTQGGLAWEMFRRPVDVLLVPAHTVPWVHPRKTVVVVHGLEYEFCPKAYAFWERWYMRITIWLSCRWAWRVIAVSENTKRDLMRLYGVAEEKIKVIYEGYEAQQGTRDKRQGTREAKEGENFQFPISKCKIGNAKFLLFIGRIEARKNVARIIEAFEMLKEKYRIPHRLVLAGKPGYGYGNIRYQISKSEYRDEIVELGYISEEKKWELLSCADIFLFPSLYEGFGLPILEAQAAGVPVITSNGSSMPEVAGEGAVLVDPYDAKDIAEGIRLILSDAEKRERAVSLGYRNAQRFSWERCAREIARVIGLKEKNSRERMLCSDNK